METHALTCGNEELTINLLTDWGVISYLKPNKIKQGNEIFRGGERVSIEAKHNVD